MNYTKLEEANELKRKIDFCKTILTKGFSNRMEDRHRITVNIVGCSCELKDDLLEDFCKLIQTKLKQYEDEFREL